MSRFGPLLRLLRIGFRDQKTRLRVDWLTHTDELILQYVDDARVPSAPPAIADAIDRSVEYVADRCRQLALRDLLEATDGAAEDDVRYVIAPRGRRYLDDDIDAEELLELDA